MDYKDDNDTVVVMTRMMLCVRPCARRWQGQASDDATRVMVVMAKMTRMTQGGCSVSATAVKAVNQRHHHRRHSSHEGRVKDVEKMGSWGSLPYSLFTCEGLRHGDAITSPGSHMPSLPPCPWL